jgi:hypothetical protein
MNHSRLINGAPAADRYREAVRDADNAFDLFWNGLDAQGRPIAEIAGSLWRSEHPTSRNPP